MKKLLLVIITLVNLYAGVTKGDNAIDFNLRSLDGTKKYTLNDFKGEVVLLNLWASWCNGCKEEMPEFFKLQNDYPSGFQLVAVSIDRDSEDAQKFLASVEKETGMKTPFTSLHDPKKILPKAYTSAGMPSSYLIDKNGVVQLVVVGSLSSDDIEELKSHIDKLK